MTVPAIWPVSNCANATLPQTEATTKRPKTATVKLRKILRAEKSENLDRDCNENDVIELLQSRSEMRNLSKKKLHHPGSALSGSRWGGQVRFRGFIHT